ncbi:MAG: MATE family efflux transporter [Solobacterium sp.]|nr:MATE family efflux transporter [Solobacterium sp.]
MAEETDNSILKETFRIAWPSVAENVLISLTGMVDTYMVSTFGKASVAAVGVTNQPRYFIYTMFFALNTAISSLVARRLGEKRRTDANGLVVTGFVFLMTAGLALTIVCGLAAKPILVLFGAKEATLSDSIQYFQIIIYFSLFQMIAMYLCAVQRGCGNTKIAMVANVAANIVHLILNWLLIFGNWGFPAMGINGAAVSTVVGMIVAMLISTRSLMRDDTFVSIPLILKEKIRPTMTHLKELLPFTGTVLGENLMTRLGFAITGGMTARLDVNSYSAHLLGMNFMNLGFAFGDGLQSAMVALVGRGMGEKNYDLCKKYVTQGQKFGLVISLISSALVLIFGRQVYRMYFPNDAEMVSYGWIISKFIALIMPIQIAKIVYNGTLRGAGDVRFTLIGSTVGVTLVQPAVQYVLTMVLNLALTGVWFSILLSQAIQLLLFFWRYRSEKWMTQVI